MTGNELPPAEIWERVAMLMARSLPHSFNPEKFLATWTANPRAGLVQMSHDVRWTRPRLQHVGPEEWKTVGEPRHGTRGRRYTALPTDEDLCSGLPARLDAGTQAPPARPMTLREQEQFWRGTYAVDPVKASSQTSQTITCKTPLSAHRVASEEIARLVGHSSTHVTETVYRQEIRPALTDGAVVMDKIFKSRAG
ncbi:MULTISPECIES: hypothetical protein [unclassified Nonomuraea]|uniref:hypothetical protein n=1 Tax=unclassified Nonomuraea TaxID=2593643 RepID=UPI0034050FEF